MKDSVEVKFETKGELRILCLSKEDNTYCSFLTADFVLLKYEIFKGDYCKRLVVMTHFVIYFLESGIFVFLCRQMSKAGVLHITFYSLTK